ncbi:hypothetical protein TNCV_2334221 [Trichonephila clavipes]|nr:hypothetical protein TNCV_2334221 [Trichonephila clavipes]
MATGSYLTPTYSRSQKYIVHLSRDSKFHGPQHSLGHSHCTRHNLETEIPLVFVDDPHTGESGLHPEVNKVVKAAECLRLGPSAKDIVGVIKAVCTPSHDKTSLISESIRSQCIVHSRGSSVDRDDKEENSYYQPEFTYARDMDGY